MRILRTEYYFDKFQVDWKGDFASASENPNLSFAWVVADAPVQAADIPNFHVADSSPEAKLEGEELDNLIRCMNLFLTSKPGDTSKPVSLSGLESPSPANRQLIEQSLDSTMAVEQSPIEEVPIKQLLGKATSWSLGTYVGVANASSSPALLVITVPLGVLIIGTAAGISKGLEAGLHRAFERRLVGPLQRSASAPIKAKARRRQKRRDGNPQTAGF